MFLLWTFSLDFLYQWTPPSYLCHFWLICWLDLDELLLQPNRNIAWILLDIPFIFGESSVDIFWLNHLQSQRRYWHQNWELNHLLFLKRQCHVKSNTLYLMLSQQSETKYPPILPLEESMWHFIQNIKLWKLQVKLINGISSTQSFSG